MSEQSPHRDGYPLKILIEVDGREQEVYHTNNLFPYLATIIKMRDRAAGDTAVSPTKSMLEEVFEQGWEMQKYFDDFIDNPDAFNQDVVELAREQYRLRDAVYDGTPESAQAWEDWNQRIGLQESFKVLQSEIFERMAPGVEADGRQPIELVI